MLLNTDLNNDKLFQRNSDQLLIREKMFIVYDMEKQESSNNYYIDNLGQLRYKIGKGKIFDFSL
jgi:hypothetical protein